MALEIGGGISFGGGISIVEDQAVVVLPNTMTIANDSGGFYYGADPTGVFGGPAGMLTSEIIRAILVYFQTYSSPSTARIYLQPGTYSGYSVGVDGNIDGDLQTYPRTFIIGGTSYTFIFDSTYDSYVYNGNLGFPSSVGETIGIEWDGNSTTPLTNSIIVSAYEGYGQLFFGASKGLNHSGAQAGPLYGTVYSSLFNEVAYYSSGSTGTTHIILNDGDYGSFTVSDGFINGDSSSSQVFEIGGTRYSFDTTGSGSSAAYTRMGDVGLVVEAGAVRTVEYDPANQGGEGHTASGTITTGNQMDVYGALPGMFGALNIIPDMVFTINYDQMQNFTTVVFKNGTYYDGIVVDDTTATIDGENEVTITVAGSSSTGTLSSTGSAGPMTTLVGDVFTLRGKVGSTVSVSVDASSAPPPSTAVTYVAATDYYAGGQFQPGIYLNGAGPSYFVSISGSAWFTMAGFTALENLTTGGTFDITMPDTGSTVYTLTLLMDWQGTSPSYYTEVSSSIPLTFSSGNSPSSVSVESGTSATSIAPTFTASPYRTNYSTGPFTLGFWYTSPTDAEYVAASTATQGNVVTFYISGTEYRGVVSSVATSTNSFYGPTGYIVTFTLSGAADGSTLPSGGTPDNSPVMLSSS